MRDCALALALLHPEALVGYCQFNECQLAPQQLWQMQGSHVPQGDIPLRAFVADIFFRKDDPLTPFFFSDELEYLYEQRITEPLHQVLLLRFVSVSM